MQRVCFWWFCHFAHRLITCTLLLCNLSGISCVDAANEHSLSDDIPYGSLELLNSNRQPVCTLPKYRHRLIAYRLVNSNTQHAFRSAEVEKQRSPETDHQTAENTQDIASKQSLEGSLLMLQPAVVLLRNAIEGLRSVLPQPLRESIGFVDNAGFLVIVVVFPLTIFIHMLLMCTSDSRGKKVRLNLKNLCNLDAANRALLVENEQLRKRLEATAASSEHDRLGRSRFRKNSDQKLVHVQKDFEELQTDYNRIEKELEDAKELEKDHQTIIEQLQNNAKEHLHELKRVQEANVGLESQLKEYKSNWEEERAKFVDAEQQLEEQMVLSSELQETIAQLEEKLNDLDQDLRSVEVVRTQLSEQLMDRETENAALSQRLLEVSQEKKTDNVDEKRGTGWDNFDDWTDDTATTPVAVLPSPNNKTAKEKISKKEKSSKKSSSQAEDQKVAKLHSKTISLESELKTVRSALEKSVAQSETLRASLTQSEDNTVRLRTMIKDKEIERKELHVRNMKLLDQLEAKDVLIREKDCKLIKADADKDALRSRIDEKMEDNENSKTIIKQLEEQISKDRMTVQKLEVELYQTHLKHKLEKSRLSSPSPNLNGSRNSFSDHHSPVSPLPLSQFPSANGNNLYSSNNGSNMADPSENSAGFWRMKEARVATPLESPLSDASANTSASGAANRKDRKKRQSMFNL